MNNHLQSKQHKKQLAKVQALREELLLDEETENVNQAAQAEIITRQQEEEETKQAAAAAYNEEGEVDSDPEAVETRKKLNKKTTGQNVEELKDEELDDIDEWTHKANKKQNKKNQKNKGAKFEEELVRKAN